MLSKAILFSFAFLGMFSLLFVAIPSSFYANQAWAGGSYFRTDQQVASFFNAHNISVYASSFAHNLTYPEHVTVSGGLPAGNQLEVTWETPSPAMHTRPPYPPYSPFLWISHETQHWFLGLFSWWTYDLLSFTTKGAISRGTLIDKATLVSDFDATMNGTYYSARCNDGIQVNILYTSPNATIGDGWDYGHLAFLMSYELNATATSVNMFTLFSQVMTFQAPNLGVPGWFGSLLNSVVAIPIWAITLFLVYKLITGIAPWLSGGSGD